MPRESSVRPATSAEADPFMEIVETGEGAAVPRTAPSVKTGRDRGVGCKG